MRYLLTGGAGFIGSHLVDALLERGDEVLVLDDLSTGREANLPVHEGLRFIRGRAQDDALLEAALRDTDACFHLAASVGVELVVRDALTALLNNVESTEAVLRTAARLRRRVVFTSTSEVYGRNPQMPLHESSDRVFGRAEAQRWGYGLSKAFGEAAMLGYAERDDADMTAVRLFNTVGTRQSPSYGMVLPRFVDQAIRGAALTVYGDGTQQRCFTHVADAVAALLLVMDTPATRGRLFNVGSSTPVSITELAEKVIAATGSARLITYVPYSRVYGETFEEPAVRRPDTSRLRATTGWQPRRTLDDAIRELVDATATGPPLRDAV